MYTMCNIIIQKLTQLNKIMKYTESELIIKNYNNFFHGFQSAHAVEIGNTDYYLGLSKNTVRNIVNKYKGL